MIPSANVNKDILKLKILVCIALLDVLHAHLTNVNNVMLPIIGSLMELVLVSV